MATARGCRRRSSPALVHAFSRCARPPDCAQSCPARRQCQCQRPAPAASAARRSDRATRRRVPCGQARLHERRRVARLSRARRCSGAGSRPPAPTGHGATSPTCSAPRCALPGSPARARRPPGSLHASSALAPPHAHLRLVRRAQADCAWWVAGRSRPWPAPPRGTTVGVREARKGAGKAT